MSFVVVFPADPTTATTCASLFSRTSARKRRERAFLVVGDERRRAPRARLVDEPDSCVQRDEEVARARPRASRPSTPVIEPPRFAALEPAERERAISSSANRDHVGALGGPRARPRGRRTGSRRRRRPGPARVPCRRSRRRHRAPASEIARAIALAPIRVDLDVHAGALQDVLDDRERRLGARIVGCHDRDVRELAPRPSP